MTDQRSWKKKKDEIIALGRRAKERKRRSSWKRTRENEPELREIESRISSK